MNDLDEGPPKYVGLLQVHLTRQLYIVCVYITDLHIVGQDLTKQQTKNSYESRS